MDQMNSEVRSAKGSSWIKLWLFYLMDFSNCCLENSFIGASLSYFLKSDWPSVNSIPIGDGNLTVRRDPLKPLFH
jgi:hypothetical protein